MKSPLAFSMMVLRDAATPLFSLWWRIVISGFWDWMSCNFFGVFVSFEQSSMMMISVLGQV